VVIALAAADLSAAPKAKTRGAAQESFVSNWSHVRPQSREASLLLDQAAEASPLVARLLDDLERSDVVVYLTDSMPGTFTGPASALGFVTVDGPTRYLMIRVDFMRLLVSDRVVALGHELQHALEIAAAPEVRQESHLADLYRRIGWEVATDRFESEAAQTTSRTVRRQLGRRDE
jgi:hypothetical protein